MNVECEVFARHRGDDALRKIISRATLNTILYAALIAQRYRASQPRAEFIYHSTLLA